MSTTQKNSSANRLTGESSRYLRLHADNPVNWHPWGDAALELAKQQEKPILLSIGYSACHWCHVMMHESFCDPEVAATMNRLFINIKVDKEERPDLDKIYQTAHQLLMGSAGGWPLTMFLSPSSLIPYFGGTYFPKNATPEIPDFISVLHRLNDVFYHEKTKIQQQESHSLAVLQIISQPQVAGELPFAEELNKAAINVIQSEFDPINSGFGTEAKFPNCSILDFLLNAKDTLDRHMALTTLEIMSQRGIYDQLAGGFFRYTVDKEWQIPHFEKMLYDNGQLLSLYAQAYKLTNHQHYRQIAIETGKWLIANMQDQTNGSFYTSIDADSEGQEGLYYVWDVSELKKILNNAEFSSINKYYQLDHKPNFEGKWHLIVDPTQTAPAPDQLAQIKIKLLQAREQRVKPAVDHKILSSCNGLLIKGLSDAGQMLNYPVFSDLAAKTIKAIQTNLYISKELYATFQDQKPKILGFLDDYAFLLYGILTFINGNPKHQYVAFCSELADSLIKNFYDAEHGGFFFTSHQAEKLFYRPKTYTDDAIPSGNGIACLALLKLGNLLNRPDYIEVAKLSIYSVQSYLNEAPELHLTLCKAYELLHKK